MLKFYKLKLERGTSRNYGSVYNLSSFTRKEVIKAENGWKMSKSSTEAEIQTTTISKNTSKSKAKREWEENNVPSKEGRRKIQKTLLEEFNKETDVPHQKMYQRPLNLRKKSLYHQG